jgi:hypothetical protein
MGIGHWWNDNWQGKTEVFREKPAPISLCHLYYRLRGVKLSADRLRQVTALKLNSVAFVRERTMPTERPPLVDEVTANFCG